MRCQHPNQVDFKSTKLMTWNKTLHHCSPRPPIWSLSYNLVWVGAESNLVVLHKDQRGINSTFYKRTLGSVALPLWRCIYDSVFSTKRQEIVWQQYPHPKVGHKLGSHLRGIWVLDQPLLVLGISKLRSVVVFLTIIILRITKIRLF